MAERITVFPEGRKASVLLTPNDLLATGGEGAVYAVGDEVFKVYLEPAKAVAAGMERKVGALQALQHPGIAAPTTILRDKSGKFVGLALPKVRGEALCKAFTNSWRDANQFGLPETAKVVEAMRAITEAAHSKQALMVDANEMNWMLSGVQPTAIDVDSWQLPGFPATAIMPSIRDYSHNTFSTGTDWFAWAIVTFQLWTGIHPYKGTHPDFARGALEPRMRALASVFDSRVKVPAAARALTDIPSVLRNWYERTFATTERCTPPSAFASAVAAQTAPRLKIRQSLSGSLKQERLGHAGDKVLAAFNGFVIARSGKELVLWDVVSKGTVLGVSAAGLDAVLHRQAAIVRTPFARVLLTVDPGVKIEARALESGETSSIPCRASSFWQSANRVFGLVPGHSNGLLEVDLTQMGARLLVTISKQWPASVLSTQFLRGLFVQDCLGAPFVGVLEGTGLLQAPAEALKGYRVADGFGLDRENLFVTALRKSDGQTVRLHLAFKTDRFVLEDETLVPDLSLDAAAASTGVGVLRDGDALVLAKGAARKRIEQAGLADDMRLFSLGAGIGGFEDGEVVKLSVVTS